jgi:DNA ligase-associated metallophosphoesterase
MDIEVAGEPLTLLPERAVFRPRNRDLLIADPHFGKDAAFRRNGVPVPAGALRDDLERLDRLLAATNPSRLVILGDFLHSRAGRTQHTSDAFLCWRRRCASLPILLIRGNHDRAAGDPPGSFTMSCEPEPYFADSLSYVHHLATRRPGTQLAGHLHPGIVIRPDRGPRIRLPCFLLTPHGLVLPAFGGFTGLSDTAPSPLDQIYAILDPKTILPVPPR